MSAALPTQPTVTEQEFLALEEAAETKHVYVNGRIMDRGECTVRHVLIAGNVLANLWRQLRKHPCRVYGSGLLVRIQHGDDVRMYYPDAAVYCHNAPAPTRVMSDPVVVVDVLSPFMAREDAGEKREAYLRTATFSAYLQVASECRLATVWRRVAGDWTREEFSNPSAIIELPKIGAQLSVADIYESVELPI